MSIEVNNETGVAVDETEIVGLARHVLAQMRVHPQAELSVILVDEPEVEQVMVAWMRELASKDVLLVKMGGFRWWTDE